MAQSLSENGELRTAALRPFLAHFHVNKAHRSFEGITVKLRDSFRVAGLVTVTEAGRVEWA